MATHQNQITMPRRDALMREDANVPGTHNRGHFAGGGVLRGAGPRAGV